jgi:hypothetical protein
LDSVLPLQNCKDQKRNQKGESSDSYCQLKIRP